MDAEAGDVERVVDVLAEKIGIAAESLAPVAQDTISQASRLGLARVVVGLVVVAICVPVMCWCMRVLKRDADDPSPEHIMGFFFACAGLIGGCVVAMVHLEMWLAPNVYVMNRLLGS